MSTCTVYYRVLWFGQSGPALGQRVYRKGSPKQQYHNACRLANQRVDHGGAVRAVVDEVVVDAESWTATPMVEVVADPPCLGKVRVLDVAACFHPLKVTYN